MKRAEYIAWHKSICDKMVAITAKKTADYTGGSDKDYAFTNFAEVEMLDITSTEVGFLTRMSDKFARIRAFVKKGVLQVADESVEDTLIDLANYSILMAGYIRSKRLEQEGREQEFITNLVDGTKSGKLTVKGQIDGFQESRAAEALSGKTGGRENQAGGV